MFVDVGGTLLHAVSFGAGPRTLLAVGGWTGSWELWEPPFELLTAAGWRCVGYDHRGCGESPADPATITLDALVDDVFAVMDALAIDRCVLAGESMGGAVAQYAAFRRPERLDGLVLVAPGSTARRTEPSDFAARCRTDYGAVVPGFVDACLPEPNVEHLRRWGRDILMRADPAQAVRLIDMWHDADVPGLDAREISVPTLVVHGTEDALVPISGGRELAALIPDAELVELVGIGHVPTLTRPQAVADAIVRRFGG